jgi:hypothetical protein
MNKTNIILWSCAVLFVALLGVLALVCATEIASYFSAGYTSEKIRVSVAIIMVDAIICLVTSRVKNRIFLTVTSYVISVCVSLFLILEGALSFVGISTEGLEIFYPCSWPTFIGGLTMAFIIAWLYLYQHQTFLNFLDRRQSGVSTITG